MGEESIITACAWAVHGDVATAAASAGVSPSEPLGTAVSTQGTRNPANPLYLPASWLPPTWSDGPGKNSYPSLCRPDLSEVCVDQRVGVWYSQSASLGRKLVLVPTLEAEAAVSVCSVRVCGLWIVPRCDAGWSYNCFLQWRQCIVHETKAAKTNHGLLPCHDGAQRSTDGRDQHHHT